ncbi:MAG TPA: hypothetical protein VK192_07675, partial [Sphingomicrobium sp.]|nr:hypothetical protein [Sphingomicrobium sp.]
QRVPQRYFLDLSDPSVQVSREGKPVRGACYGPGTSGGGAPIRLPLRVSLAALKPGDYAIHERVTYDVTIENIGTIDITLPSLASQSLADDYPSDRVLMASVVLQTQDEKGRDVSFAPRSLEGTPAVPKSTIVLKPRDTATIRAEGMMEYIGESPGAVRPPLNRELKMNAVLRLTTAPCRWAASIASDNAVTVVLRQKQ